MAGVNLVMQIGNKEIRFSDLDEDKECELVIYDQLDSKVKQTFLDKENIISLHKYLEYLIENL